MDRLRGGWRLDINMAACAAVIFVGMGCCLAGTRRIQSLEGTYCNGEAVWVIKNDRLFEYRDGKKSAEAYVKVRGTLVYISADIPTIKKMIRNVWAVYERVGDRLVVLRLEDINDGTRFYENLAGTDVWERCTDVNDHKG